MILPQKNKTQQNYVDIIWELFYKQYMEVYS